MADRTVTARQAATLLGVSLKRVLGLRDTGKVRAVGRVEGVAGVRHLFRLSDVRAALAIHRWGVAHPVPEGCMTCRDAALSLGMDERTIGELVKTGRLDGESVPLSPTHSRHYPRADAVMEMAAERARAAHRARVRARAPAPPELPYGGFLSVEDHAVLMQRRVMYTQRREAAR